MPMGPQLGRDEARLGTKLCHVMKFFQDRFVLLLQRMEQKTTH